MFFLINPKLLLEIDNSGYGGGPCSAGAAATLDFIAEVLADVVSEQLKATQSVENILESVPLYVDVESTLVFQGLCLSRLMNFLERRLLRDDEEDDKKLDKNCWSVNLDSLCWMIVDHLYMGSFPKPVGVIRTLEFVLSMLQLANKDGHVEDAVPAGKGILSAAQNLAVDIIKYLLVRHRSALEDLLVSKPNQGHTLDVLHGGLDKYALESGQDLMSTELRSIRQDKYGWVLHAESEWQTQLQQLVHERGIFPILHASVEPEWKLCPIEGPYRMQKHENDAHTSGSESDSCFNLSSNDAQEKGYDGGDHEETLFKEESSKIESLSSAQIGWNDNGHRSMHEPSVHFAMEFQRISKRRNCLIMVNILSGLTLNLQKR
ncbi:unnamed protein product [Musa acuminata subsp. burmannicoides]